METLTLKQFPSISIKELDCLLRLTLAPVARRSTVAPKRVRMSNLRTMAAVLNQLAIGVDHDWANLSPELQAHLMEVAVTYFDKQEQDIQPPMSFLRSFRRFRAYGIVIQALITDGLDGLIEDALCLQEAGDRLMHAVVEAINHSEISETHQFLKFLVRDLDENGNKCIPYTREMDNTLTALLDGVESDECSP